MKEVNVNNNEVNDNINRQSKVKESKAKQIEVKQTKVNKNKVEELIAELFTADKPSDIENILNDLEDVGWSNVYSALEATEDMKKKLRGLVQNKQIILETA